MERIMLRTDPASGLRVFIGLSPTSWRIEAGCASSLRRPEYREHAARNLKNA